MCDQSVMWAILVHVLTETSARIPDFSVPEHTPCTGIRQDTIAYF